MDYAKASTQFLAKMVFSGAKEIDEFPIARRTAIAARVKALQAEAAEAKKKEAKRAKAERKTKRKAKTSDAV